MTTLPDRKASGSRWLMGIAIVVPLGLFILLSYIAPRPFYVVEDDSENSIFYNAYLLYSGYPVYQVSHPGTPIHYLVFGLMSAVGIDLKELSPFFTLLHLVAGLVTSLAFFLFVWLTLRRYPIGVALLALSALVAWPSFLTYLDYFDTNSFFVPLGLPMLAVCWKDIEEGQATNRRMIVAGTLLGLCLAVKLSFLPLAAAVMVATWMLLFPSINNRQRSWKSLLIPPVTTGLSFLLFTLPIFGRVPNSFLTTLSREDTRPEGWDLAQLFFNSLEILRKANSTFIFLLAITAIAFLYLSAKLFLVLRNRRSSVADGQQENFGFFSAAMFLLMTMLSFIYGMVCPKADSRDPGMLLRNVAPMALAVPFLILYSYRALLSFGSIKADAPVIQVSLVLFATLVTALGVSSYFSRRGRIISSHLERSVETRSRLEVLRKPGTRIAFWDGSPGDSIGPESFHFWGNYGYANDQFDRLLLDKYPSYTFFRLREVSNIIENSQRPNQGPPAPRGSSLGKPGILWRRVFPEPFTYRSTEIIAGENDGVLVSLIAFPEDEGPKGATETEWLKLINDRFGVSKIWKERMAGVNWILISLASPSSTN